MYILCINYYLETQTPEERSKKLQQNTIKYDILFILKLFVIFILYLDTVYHKKILIVLYYQIDQMNFVSIYVILEFHTIVAFIILYSIYTSVYSRKTKRKIKITIKKKKGT